MTIIGTNRFFDQAASQLNLLNARNATLQTQISTGKRLAAPSDDAAGYNRLQRLAQGNADSAGWTQNIKLAQTLLQQSDTALDAVTAQLQRAQELTVQASNGTLSPENQQAIAAQLRGIVDSLVSVANSPNARGEALFSAATGDSALVRDPSTGAISFGGAGDPASIAIGTDSAVQSGESAQRIFGGIPTASGPSDVFAILGDIATSLESGAGVGANGALDSLKSALDQVGAVRSSIGARSARLDLEATRLDNDAINREAERSGLEDTDLQSAIVELQKTSTVLQATQASLARLTSLSLFDYLR